MWKPAITRQERLLQAALRAQKIGCKCNPKISGYFPDLWIIGTNILIEVDGGVHRSKQAKARDKRRTNHLNLAGYRVLRFSNRQVETAIAAVVERIKSAIAFSRTGRSGIVFRSNADRDRVEQSRAKAKRLNQL